jgi:nucleoside-diphosphate-sugar epimerase
VKLAVTGAAGFLGRAVVDAALARGHQVVAVVRSEPAQGDHRDVEWVRCDLRQPSGLATALAGVDAVLHLAATKDGDFHTQFAGTVIGTENLLEAVRQAGVPRVVAISSFSVYDFAHLPRGALLDEDRPLERAPQRRDDYARTKLAQEDLVRRFEQEGAAEVVVLRPGLVFGPGEVWHSLLGSPLGPVFLRVGGRAVLPLTYVANCAEAVVLAAEVPGAAGTTLNVVDDDLPTQAQYARAAAAVVPAPRMVTVPWPVMRSVARLVDTGASRLLGPDAKLPGIVVPHRLDARFKPLRYSNQRARSVLGWAPRVHWRQALTASAGDGHPHPGRTDGT